MDFVADALTRIKNGIKTKKKQVIVLKSKITKNVLDVMVKEGLIGGYKTDEKGFNVELLYVEGEPVITHLDKVSKIGQRIYVTANEILPYMNGRGVYILSTSQGVMSGAVAKSKNIGGELICKIW